MSDLELALRFIRDHQTIVTQAYPDVGQTGPEEPVVFAKVEGDVLGWIAPGGEGEVREHAVFVRSVQAAGDEVHVHLAQEFPHVSLVFRAATSEREKALYVEAIHLLDDDLDDAEVDLDALMAETKAPKARKKRSFSFVHWSEFRSGIGLRPAGVMGVTPAKKLMVVPFAGFEDAGERWEGRFYKAPALEDLQEHAGRTTLLSGVEEIEGYDYHDALTRAAHRVAGRIYQEEGKVILR